jgi:hypothetical protein
MRAHDRRLAAKAASAAARDSFVDDPKIATVVECQSRPIMNLLLELMAFAIWFLINHLGPLTLPPLWRPVHPVGLGDGKRAVS